MLKRFRLTAKLIAALSLALSLAMGSAFATNYHSTTFVVQKGKGHKTDYIVKSGKDKIGIMVPSQALDAYMDEQGVNSVTITVDLVEEWVETEIGGYYRLEFTFGPHGAFFTYPLQVYLIGKYSSPETATLIYAENGEVVESWNQPSGNITTFYIDHFSSYSYDHY